MSYHEICIQCGVDVYHETHSRNDGLCRVCFAAGQRKYAMKLHNKNVRAKRVEKMSPYIKRLFNMVKKKRLALVMEQDTSKRYNKRDDYYLGYWEPYFTGYHVRKTKGISYSTAMNLKGVLYMTVFEDGDKKNNHVWSREIYEFLSPDNIKLKEGRRLGYSECPVCGNHTQPLYEAYQLDNGNMVHETQCCACRILWDCIEDAKDIGKETWLCTYTVENIRSFDDEFEPYECTEEYKEKFGAYGSE